MSTVLQQVEEIECSEEIYLQYLKSVTSDKNTSSVQSKLKNLGDQNFMEKNYLEAIHFYNKAVKMSPSNVTLLANRAVCYLKMGCYKKTLIDTSKILEINPFHIKAIYRHVKSLWGLKQYREALRLLNLKLFGEPVLAKNIILSNLKQTAITLLYQYQTGEFDNIVQFLGRRDTNDIIDVAEYIGQIKWKNILGKGRGLVATGNINAGQVIICSKAFAIYNHKNVDINMNYEENKLDRTTGHDKLVEQIAQKLTLEPEQGSKFYNLCASRQLGIQLESAKLTLDMKRIKQIVHLNAFSNFDSYPLDSNENITTGIWLAPSYINHSCSDSNCYWQIFGDVMFIRAIQNIRVGNEILIPYINPSLSLDERQSVFREYDFICRCTLCQLQMKVKESKEIQERRNQILKTLQQLKKMDIQMDVDAAKKNILELECLQKMNYNFPHSVILDIAIIFYKLKEDTVCLELLEKVHYVTKDSVFAKEAVTACLHIARCYIRRRDRVNVIKWINQLKHDLLIAFGSVRPIWILGGDILPVVESFGWNFADSMPRYIIESIFNRITTSM